MLAARCACGFERLADEEVTDHLLAVFAPPDAVGADGQVHEEGDARTCLCGFFAASVPEMDAHFLAAFTPAGSAGRDGSRHEAIA